MHPDYTPPIRPYGANSIEARVKALEVAQGYDVNDMKMLREDMHNLSNHISSVSSELSGLQRRAAMWTISALISAVTALALIVVKIKMPWMPMP